jgi:hypothetical protein
LLFKISQTCIKPWAAKLGTRKVVNKGRDSGFGVLAIFGAYEAISDKRIATRLGMVHHCFYLTWD